MFFCCCCFVGKKGAFIKSAIVAYDTDEPKHSAERILIRVLYMSRNIKTDFKTIRKYYEISSVSICCHNLHLHFVES